MLESLDCAKSSRILEVMDNTISEELTGRFELIDRLRRAVSNLCGPIPENPPDKDVDAKITTNNHTARLSTTIEVIRTQNRIVYDLLAHLEEHI